MLKSLLVTKIPIGHLLIGLVPDQQITEVGIGHRKFQKKRIFFGIGLVWYWYFLVPLASLVVTPPPVIKKY